MNLLILCLLPSVTKCSVNSRVLDTSSFPPAQASFTCQGRLPGYYADLEDGCRTYHVCDGNSQFTYVCPNRTLFQQKSRICDHSYLVHCENSPRFYEPRDVYSDDEGEILFSSAAPKENLSSIEVLEDVYNETKGFSPTETTRVASETTLFTADDLAEVTTPLTSATPASTPEVTIFKTRTESMTTQSEALPDPPVQKYLRILLKDFRSLFFIPEFNNNSVVAQSEREFLLPMERSEFVKFKNRKNTSRTLPLCPSYCNPKFFLPGTCHPCIMIK